MPFTIDVKHDSKHRTWKRLSVVALMPGRLMDDLEAHVAQYAKDNDMDPQDIAGRVVEIDSSQIGSRDITFMGVPLMELPGKRSTKSADASQA